MGLKGLIKPALIIFVIAALAIVAGAVIALNISSKLEVKNVSMTTLEIKGIQADVQSSSDGSKHNVTMNVYFELSDDLVSSLGVKTLKKQLAAIISKMDYDRLLDNDNIKYVKEYFISYYSDDIDESEIGELYVTDIVTGPHKFYSAEPVEDTEPEIELDIRRQQRFSALFENVEF